MKRLIAPAAVLCLILAASGHQALAQVPPPPAMLSTKDIMRHVLNPAAELFWANSGDVDEGEGAQTRAPTAADEAKWASMVDASAVVLESGNLLLAPGRNRNEKVWTDNSRKLVEAGVDAMKAAREKNPEAAFNAGSKMYEACFACHRQYIPRRKS